MKKFFNRLFRNLLITLIAFLVIAFQFDLFSNASTLKFVQLTDVHLSNRDSDTSYKLLTKSSDLLDDAINQINGFSGVDFVMLTGDGIDTPSEKLENSLCDKMNRLKYPWYMALGNHDISLSGWLTKERFISNLKEKNKNFTFSKSYYSFVPKEGFRVIVLDGVIDYKLTTNGYISEDQLRWLNNQLSTSKNEIILIFMHYPLVEPYSSSHHRIQNEAELTEILNRYKMPVAIFSGHYHAGKITKQGHILHVSSPSLVGYPNAFRLVTVSNLSDKVVFKFSFKETGLTEVQKQAKMLVFSSSAYYGAEADRNTTVIIDK